MTERRVQNTDELRRVIALPRRVWLPEDEDDLARRLTQVLRTPSGTMELRPVQARALFELSDAGGLFASMRVGAGKTLTSLLAPRVLHSRRPLLLVPAKLKAKTGREHKLAMRDWQVPNWLRTESYELLGRVQAKDLLERYQPDLIIADECHRLKNLRAAVTKRVLRYLWSEAGRACVLAVMSGTVTDHSLKDFAHLLERALWEANAPIACNPSELEEWAEALDEREFEDRIHPGALLQLRGPEEADAADDLEAARRAYRRRLAQTPGVVATVEPFLGCSLSVTALQPPANRAAFARLREFAELPDNTLLADAVAVWRHARELALGFFYRWDPPPPQDWMDARREWSAACRYILTHNRRDLDSELDVANAVDDGLYPAAEDALEAWRTIKDSFKPNTVPVWIDDAALDAAAKWAEAPGIVWVEHVAFGEELSRRTGMPYYGRKGQDARGRPIPEFGEAGSGAGSIIASIASNGTGRNLQAWSRNLFTAAPSTGRLMEQLLGRTHREGQAADEVTVECFITCKEQADAIAKARARARYIEHTTGQAQKILYADVDCPGPEAPGLL